MATHSSTLAWRIPWTEDLAGYSSWDCRVRHDCTTNIPFVFQHHTPVVFAATEIQRAPSAPKGRGVPVLPLSHCCFPLPSGPTTADLQSCFLLFGCHHCPCCAIWAALAVPCTSSVCCFLCLASFPFFSL